jgi:hypothetical protein
MRTILRTVLTGCALLGISAVAEAQAPASPVLNSVELRKLVASPEPDHARLRAHFVALADRYAAEVNRHTTMSRAYTGSRSPGLATGMQAHCARLAELATQSAATVRELAAYHDKLAAGVPATAPRGAAPFEAGAGARKPTSEELNALAKNAKTPADHRALEEYFLTLAKRETAEAEEYAADAHVYRGTRMAAAAVHYDRLAALARDSAKEANAAATMHQGLAGIAR